MSKIVPRPVRESGESASRVDWWNSIPSTVKRVMLSLVLGVAAFLLTSFGGSHSNLEQQLNFSLLIAGLAIIVQFLGDVERRMGSVEIAAQENMRGIEDSLVHKFAELNSATQLMDTIEKSAIPNDVVTQLVRNATRIDQEKPALIRSFAQMEIARYSEFFEQLGSGMVTYEGEDRDWLLTLTRAAEVSIFATSLTTVDSGGETFDRGFWVSDLGQRYLEAQSDAIKLREVKIKRLFVLDRSSLRDDPALKRVCDRQKDIGIELRILAMDEQNDARTPLFDFIVFDECLSYEMTPGSMTDPSTLPMILETTIESHQAKIQERMRRFKDLWELSSKK